MPPVKKNWGFPRWGGYGKESQTTEVKLCDYHGCRLSGQHPAPKSPYTKDKWWFCEDHAAEYNKNWNFFEGMRDEEARTYARRERAQSSSYSTAGHWAWGGARDEQGVNRIERAAYDVLGVPPSATLSEIKKKYRELAKRHHPDLNKNDAVAAQKFQALTFAYEVLKGRLTGKRRSDP